MNDACFSLAEQLVSSSYIQQAQQARRARESMVKSLLAQRRMPETGWDEGTLRLLLQEIALMDSNTFVGNAGVGEREARIICPLVAQRHFGLGHGIGRSGDIAEEQPKAAGSSLLYKLTNNLAQDALRRAGATGVCDCLVLPLATGMSLTLCLLALRQTRPGAPAGVPAHVTRACAYTYVRACLLMGACVCEQARSTWSGRVSTRRVASKPSRHRRMWRARLGAALAPAALATLAC